MPRWCLGIFVEGLGERLNSGIHHSHKLESEGELAEGEYRLQGRQVKHRVIGNAEEQC